MLRRNPGLLVSPLVTMAVTLAFAAPALADDDDDFGGKCPCWTRADGLAFVTAALAEDPFAWACESEIEVEDGEREVEAEFVTSDVDLDELDELDLDALRVLSAELAVDAYGNVIEAECEIEVDGEDVVEVEGLSEKQALRCIDILDGICDDLRKIGDLHDDDDDDDEEDDD